MSLGRWLKGQLFARRIVLVTGRLDDDAAAEAAAALMALDARADKPVELHLDSADGTLEAAFVLIDTLDLLRAMLRVQCRGQVDGPAIGVVAAADHRAAAPHARFHLSQPTERFAGTPDEIAALSRQQQDLLWRLYARLARAGRVHQLLHRRGGAGEELRGGAQGAQVLLRGQAAIQILRRVSRGEEAPQPNSGQMRGLWNQRVVRPAGSGHVY